MLSNACSNIEFYCMNHEPPIPLYVYPDSNSPFYACKKFMAKDDEHPDGHEVGEPACSNRLSFALAAAIMDKISSAIEETVREGDIVDWNGWQFKYKGIRVKILEYSLRGGVSKVGIDNQNVINTWR